MTETTTIVEALGGKSVLKKKISTPMELSETIREGLPYASLEALVSKLRLPRNEAAAALKFSERTLARRRREKRFRPDESDRVLRLARLFALATRILESEENAAKWFSRHNRALGGKSPLDLIDTEIGAREAETVLWRIAYGMFS